MFRLSENGQSVGLKLIKKLAKLEASDIKSKEYIETILMTLRDASRSGRPIIFTAEQVVQIVAMACEVKDNSDSHVSHWTHGDLAAEAVNQGIADSISVSNVGRFLSEAHIKPHKNRYWLNARFEDPEQFLAEARTVCDLYHSAQQLFDEKVFVVSTDEKTGIQATERRHPTHPAKPELREHGYDRHGTVTIHSPGKKISSPPFKKFIKRLYFGHGKINENSKGRSCPNDSAVSQES